MSISDNELVQQPSEALGAVEDVKLVNARTGAFACARGEFTVPIRYRDAESFIVIRPTSRAQLQELLPPQVRARRVFGDYGALVVQFSDFRTTSIGPYNECIVAVLTEDAYTWPIAPQDLCWDAPLCYSVWLAVSSELAMVSGRALWGYPKEIGQTTLSSTRTDLHAHVAVRGRTVLSCQVRRPEQVEEGAIRLRSQSHVGGRLSYTAVDGRAEYGMGEYVDGELLFASEGSRLPGVLDDTSGRQQFLSVIHLNRFAFDLPLPFDTDRSATSLVAIE